MQFKKKKTKRKEEKKGGNGKGPVIIYRLKEAEVWRILGITQFSGERRGGTANEAGRGGGDHKNITEPHGGMGEYAKLHCDTPRILRPPISPPPPPPPPPRR